MPDHPPSIDPHAIDVVGLDLGGTKLAAALMSAGALGEARVVLTPHASSAAVIDALVEAVEAVRSEQLAAVGLGVPSVIDWATGMARSSVNLPLENVPVRAVLRERLGVPVYVDNDANVAALAEASDGAGITVRHLVMLTIGTGVGGGIVINHLPYRGATGAAAELGHQIIGADVRHGSPPAVPHPPHPASLEALAAGPALGRLAAAAGALDGHEHPDGRDVVRAAHAGDEKARALLRTLGERIGIGVANAINTFDPDVVVLGGGVAAAGEWLLEPVREAAARYVIDGVGTKTEIRLARYGNDAGVRGAALLAAHELAADQRRMRPTHVLNTGGTS